MVHAQETFEKNKEKWANGKVRFLGVSTDDAMNTAVDRIEKR
jgi:hypothetical protein